MNAEKVSNEAEQAKLDSLLADDNSKYQQLQQEYQTLQLTVSTLTDRISIVEAGSGFRARTVITATVTLLFDQTLVAGEGRYSGRDL